MKMPWYINVESQKMDGNTYIMSLSVNKFYLFLLTIWLVLTKVNFSIKWGK